MNKSETLTSFFIAVFAFTFWGFVPVYWKQLAAFGPMELLGHRLFWGFITLGIYLFFAKRFDHFGDIIKDKRKLLFMVGSTSMIGVNWIIFIWAVNANHLVETSLGYFINPILNVLFGVIILREHLSRNKWISVVLATIGVIIMSSGGVGEVWISLSLAGTFGVYGLLRKKAGVPSLPGLFFEMGLALPFLLGWLYLKGEPLYFFEANNYETVLALLAGIMTILPLASFGRALQSLNLSTVGFIQYLAPILQLVLGVLIYNEPFTKIHLWSFSFIWAAIALFSFDGIVKARSGRMQNV